MTPRNNPVESEARLVVLERDAMRADDRLSELREEMLSRHADVMVAISSAKHDIMLHVDERIGGMRRECDLRHNVGEKKAASKSSLSLQKWQIVAALVGTMFASSTTATIVSNLFNQPSHVQVQK